MSRLRAAIVLFAAVALMAGPLGVPAQAGASGAAGVSASAKAKKKCNKFKGKKKRQCLKNASKGNGGGGKPWAGSPYRPGITCSLSAEMGKKYARYGLFCLDLGFGITTLEPL